MKTKFNILSASLVGIVCASIMTPSFAASSVRSLGGAGTFTGTSSVRSNTAASTSGSAVSAARAGSIRINNGTSAKVNSGASLRTPSTRSAAAPRLSIGKYLAGSSALGGGSSSGGNVNVGQSGVSSTEIKEIKEGLAALEAEIENMTGGAADVEFTYDESTGELIFVHGGETFYADLATQESVAALEERLNEAILSAGATIEADENAYIKIAVDEDKNTKTVSAILSALDNGALTDGLTTAAAVTDYVTGYAIPKPSANCFEDTVCVLSVGKDKQYYWLELVDEVASPVATTSEIYESDTSDEALTDL
ncbi:MAG: hypothetical protein R8M71_01050 [Alphaproteobacteria bacterium]|nr:hypothetical protein [Alphaproteobacteria bacterium]